MFLWRNLKPATILAALTELSDEAKRRDENTAEQQKNTPRPEPSQPATAEPA